ncbi:MAG: DEAD/DEAH box helicase family protein [Thauera sp.]|nr:DEAD/DEAH box helicase family protein [Thauera sp.]
MSNPFFEHPILNSPYAYPQRHWELDEQGQPTQRIVDSRRRAEFITPIPKPKKRKSAGQQAALIFDEGAGLSSEAQQYDHTATINAVRAEVDKWRTLPEAQWRVTPETARLLRHWRQHEFAGIRPFFCQIEAVETAIWLTEVAPSAGKNGQRFVAHLANANAEANPELLRVALKLATGAGKTTVMAMLIAWQTINAARYPNSKRFTRGFLIVAPGITIRDRLRVLQPNDPDSYYSSRELIPADLMPELGRARIVITNYHAFKLRERVPLSKGGRLLLQGRDGAPLQTLETEGQMLQRVMPELMGMKNILAINDEAHHCYREKPDALEDEDLKGDERKEAEQNNEAARLWISGLEAVGRKLGLARVVDLSATPFFLRGSGYAEGTLFPWTMSDCSLMDAIECGIVKLPRVPVADNIPGGEMPKFRNLWDHIRSRMPKNFRDMAADEIERFRREIVERTGDRQRAEKITDQGLLREVMNTVGKQGRLGESIRCVVSVSMLTEGWDPRGEAMIRCAGLVARAANCGRAHPDHFPGVGRMVGDARYAGPVELSGRMGADKETK